MQRLDHIPHADEVEIKPKFEKRYRALLGDRYEDFIKYSFSYINKSVRVNTLKITVKDLKKRLQDKWNLTQIPWCKEGFWIEDKERNRYDIGNLIEHQLGYVYIQEAASMIPPVVLSPKPGDIVLDMCAAPGSKTTQMGSYMKNKGVLVANDLSGNRLKALGINLQKCGISNSIMTRMPGHLFKKKSVQFDKVLVDAPCSGTGTIRTSLKTLKIWNPNSIKVMQGIQKHCLDSGFSILKKGGTLVYSTCSQEPDENEAVVSWLLEKYENAKLEKINLNIKRSDALTEFEGKQYNSEVVKTLRIYPQDNNTEGFYVAKIKKS